MTADKIFHETSSQKIIQDYRKYEHISVCRVDRNMTSKQVLLLAMSIYAVVTTASGLRLDCA